MIPGNDFIWKPISFILHKEVLSLIPDYWICKVGIHYPLP